MIVVLRTFHYTKWYFISLERAKLLPKSSIVTKCKRIFVCLCEDKSRMASGRRTAQCHKHKRPGKTYISWH